MIRPLEVTDYDKHYLALLNQLRPVESYELSSFERVYKDYQDNNQHYIFVIEEENRIVGTITVLLETKFIYEGRKLAHIEDLVVHEDHRKKGYGGKLVDYCVDFCKKQGCKKIALCSRKTAEEFYNKKGFDVIGNYFAKYLDL